jgi:predicted dehydrogenase
VKHIPFIDAYHASPHFELHNVRHALQRGPLKSSTDSTRISIKRPGISSGKTEGEFFADEYTDLVVLGTHPTTHTSLAKMALEAGKYG